MIIGDRITQRREDLLLTQEDIAKYIGVRVETIDNKVIFRFSQKYFRPQ